MLVLFLLIFNISQLIAVNFSQSLQRSLPITHVYHEFSGVLKKITPDNLDKLLAVAAIRGTPREISVLAYLGANVDRRDHITGYAPVHLATRFNPDLRSLVTLLNHGACYDSKAKGKTLAELAEMRGEKDRANFMLFISTLDCKK